jgi:hypothetical protein
MKVRPSRPFMARRVDRTGGHQLRRGRPGDLLKRRQAACDGRLGLATPSGPGQWLAIGCVTAASFAVLAPSRRRAAKNPFMTARPAGAPP